MSWIARRTELALGVLAAEPMARQSPGLLLNVAISSSVWAQSCKERRGPSGLIVEDETHSGKVAMPA